MAAKTNADVVIIGGGILGASIAWHLTRAGISDIVVVERNEVACGATAYAAGLVSLARTDGDVLTMVRCTLSAIAELEASLEESVGFHRTGTMRIAELAETSVKTKPGVPAISATSGASSCGLEPEQATIRATTLQRPGRRKGRDIR